MITYTTIQCPNCGANLSIEEGRESAFCSYCGSKVVIQDDREQTIIYRHIDEAKIKHEETERMVKLRLLDLLEKEQFGNKGLITIWIAATVLLLVVGIIGAATGNAGMMICLMIAVLSGLYGYLYYDKRIKNGSEIEARRSGKIKIPKSSLELKNKDYQAVESEFRAVGFKDIRTVNLKDLTTGLLKKPGTIDHIVIGGDGEFEAGKWVMPETTVIIAYHGFSD